jgi:tRNA pseudouridine55 synthase
VSPRARRGRAVHGILLLDKPLGLTSNRALQTAKRLFAAAKAGHSGALDPLATGMLPICFGAATKLSGFLLDARKTYRVTAVLGTATDTGDADGEVIERRNETEVADATVRSAAAGFIGEIEQVPPMYSALKHRGKRLYELARAGREVERAPRRVRIESLVIDRYRWPALEFTVACSKGTYIRSLVVDIAASLGTVGHVGALRRLSVGPFEGLPMHTLAMLEQLEASNRGALEALLQPLDSAVAALPPLVMTAAQTAALVSGQQLEAEAGWRRGLVRLYSPEEVLFGLGEISAEGALRPRRMFPEILESQGRSG